MKILSWNCQGCGNPKTTRALKKLIAKHQPDVVFLMETKQLSSNYFFLSNFANEYCTKTIDCSTSGGGRAGGLALMWKNCNFELNIIDYDLNHIDCMINSHNMLWRATGIYGYPINNQKILTCNLISDLAKTNTNTNWLVFGDFNIVLSSNEKAGGNPIDYHVTEAFRDCLEHSNLEDLGYNGDQYTWHNRQQDNHYIQARLDRFCATSDWTYNFSHYQNFHLLRYGSDHCPILLDFSNLPPPIQEHNRPRGKRFEQIWTEDEDHTRIVKEAWDNHNHELQNKLEDTLSSLHNWGKEKFGNIPKKIKAAQNELQHLNSQNHSGDLMESIKNKEHEIDNLLYQEEMWWSQMSRVLWLKHGDRNTSFFHSKASHRRNKNRIETITDTQGITHTELDKIEETLITHF
jgi:exonuclease III